MRKRYTVVVMANAIIIRIISISAIALERKRELKTTLMALCRKIIERIFSSVVRRKKIRNKCRGKKREERKWMRMKKRREDDRSYASERRLQSV